MVHYGRLGPFNTIFAGTKCVHLVHVVAIFRGSETLFESREPAHAYAKKRAASSDLPIPKVARTEGGEEKKEEDQESGNEKEGGEEESKENDVVVGNDEKGGEDDNAEDQKSGTEEESLKII